MASTGTIVLTVFIVALIVVILSAYLTSRFILQVFPKDSLPFNRYWLVLTILLLFISAIITQSAGQNISGIEPNGFVIFGYGCGVFLFFAVVFLLVLDILITLPWFIYSKISRKQYVPLPQQNSKWPKIRGGIVFLLALVLTPISFALGNKDPQIVHVDLYSETWPKEMDGFKMLQINDIHVGSSIGKSSVQGIVNLSIPEDPEMVVIVGDLVDGNPAKIGETISPLTQFNASYGTFFVTGNHEYISGHVDEWIALLAKMNIKTLRNERLFIHSLGKNESRARNPNSWWSSKNSTLGGHPLISGFYLAGVDDLSAAGKDTPSPHGANITAALANRNMSYTSILMAHQPNHIFEAGDQCVDLQLSGHTHQGQIFPMHIGTYAYNAYFAGLYKHSKCTSIYVNRGTNQWGPPARLGAWKEITVWHMHHGSNQVRVR